MQKLRKHHHVLIAANGTRIAVLGEVSLPFTFGHYSTVVTGLVSEHVSEVILGIGWLVENGVTWDFCQSRIRIGEVYYPLHSRPDADVSCRRVVSQSSMVIPARSEVDVPTKIILRSLPGSFDDGDVCWSTDISSVTPGVHVSRTVIPVDRLVDIPVRVMNARSEPFTLKAGTSLANLQPVTIVGSIPFNCQPQMQEQVMYSIHSNETPSFAQLLVDNVHESLPESTRRVLTDILIRRADVFSQSEDDLGTTDIVTHSIDTADAKPIRERLRRYPPSHMEAILSKLITT